MPHEVFGGWEGAGRAGGEEVVAGSDAMLAADAAEAEEDAICSAIETNGPIGAPAFAGGPGVAAAADVGT